MKSKVDNFPPSMDAVTAIRDRRSVRAFLNKTVSEQQIKTLLDIARWAPSGVNTQPWQVAVLGPQTRQAIGQAIIALRESKTPDNPDYHYYPEEWFEPYKARRKACGLKLYSALGIEVHDGEERKKQWYRNYTFFDAPVAFIFHIDASLQTGSWMDCAMFIQNLMLAARAMGLETCPQAALAEYPQVIREALQLTIEHKIICGLALGYADWSHPINQYRTEREAVEAFTTWYD